VDEVIAILVVYLENDLEDYLLSVPNLYMFHLLGGSFGIVEYYNR
tara:strand:- start:5 stop:139 length:135 start_codon:yes stop_codon:yes gene_type:complete